MLRLVGSCLLLGTEVVVDGSLEKIYSLAEGPKIFDIVVAGPESKLDFLHF